MAKSDDHRDAATIPVTEFKGVGAAVAQKLARLGLETVQDVLFHLPLRYEDRSRVVPIGAVRPGQRVTVEGEVEHSETVFRGRRRLLCHVRDGTGGLGLRFFHFSRAQAAGLARGARIRCFGEARLGSGGIEMVHPEYRLLRDDSPLETVDHLTPVYPTTEGVQQGRLRYLTDQALERLDERLVREWLPDSVLSALKMPPLIDALRFVHRPPTDAPLDRLNLGTHACQQRLAFEELLAHRLSLRRLREAVREDAAPVLRGDGRLERRFIDALPFELTGAQERVLTQISDDLERDSPALRLIQGDVGSGKTVVAAAAAVKAAAAGAQVAVMAPTEILAEQHLRSFRGWLDPLGVRVAWLTGRLRSAERRDSLAAIASGEAQVVVGTHALFQKGVDFKRLGLVIVDEQHRFGVHQRMALRDKGSADGLHPHQLVMTATPIPRTLAMTAYADLDVSEIDELPPGRRPVTTVAVSDRRRDEVVARVRQACADGQQVYWVCPLIEESETLQCQAAEDAAAMLAEALPELLVGLVHGRMKPADKEAAMAAFKGGDTHLLVATTVIEVGVDVPNASLMIIENSERMGLAQLHQLRGRVGRGSKASSCVLMYRPPLGRQARERLSVLRRTNNGFEVAERDLELRGAGEVLGTRQTGAMQMRVADLVRDTALLPRVARAAQMLLADYPSHVDPLVRRWIGEGQRYGQV